MGVFAGPEIKESGLVLALDAGNRKTFANSVINSTSWSLGSGSATGYSQNGATAENERVTGTDPFGKSATVWETRPQGNNADDGGWNSDWSNIDSTKLHRFSVWVKRTTDTSGGTFYFGLYGNNGIRRTDNNAVEGNPYWDCRGTGGFVKDVWYLVTGHCYPYNTIYTGQHPESGIYTVAGGTTKVASINACNIGADVKWAGADVTQAIHRCYHFYCSDSTTRLQFFDPRIDVIDGTEPSIANLLSGFTANRLTDLIGTNNGTFVNGPTYSSANGGSIVFDGVDDYTSISNNSLLSFGTNSFTINLWIRRITTNSFNPIITTYNNYNSGYSTYFYAGIYNASNVYETGFTILTSGGSHITTLSAIPITNNEWINVSATRSGDNITLYRNGSFYSTASSQGNNWSGTGRPTLIGGGVTGATPLNGNISQVSIYDRALSAAEIQQNFNATKSRYGL